MFLAFHLQSSLSSSFFWPGTSPPVPTTPPWPPASCAARRASSRLHHAEAFLVLSRPRPNPSLLGTGLSLSLPSLSLGALPHCSGPGALPQRPPGQPGQPRGLGLEEVGSALVGRACSQVGDPFPRARGTWAAAALSRAGGFSCVCVEGQPCLPLWASETPCPPASAPRWGSSQGAAPASTFPCAPWDQPAWAELLPPESPAPAPRGPEALVGSKSLAHAGAARCGPPRTPTVTSSPITSHLLLPLSSMEQQGLQSHGLQ